MKLSTLARKDGIRINIQHKTNA